MIEQLEKVKDLCGDYAEIGVHKGNTFVKIAELAKSHNKLAFAVDSFEGMAEPSKFDGILYPCGKFNVFGTDSLKKKLSECDLMDYCKIVKGFIPAVLEQINCEMFSFVHLDVDHYLPTLQALEFLKNHIVDGGILMAHDYFPDRDTLASKAINEWCEKYDMPVTHYPKTLHGVIQF